MSAGPCSLVIRVRLLDGRYHGEPEWPPAPARLFQALVAAASRGSHLDGAAQVALRWLECLDPPGVSAPAVHSGQQVSFFVPNNDLDAKGGDPDAVAGIRVAKRVRPRLLEADAPLEYAWDLAELPDEALVAALRETVHGLYQLGRGVDVAHAELALVAVDARDLFGGLPGVVVHFPTVGGQGGSRLACPQRGSLDSLIARHAASARRFTGEKVGRKDVQVFQQAPKPRFAEVVYDSPPRRVAFDLRVTEDSARSSVTPMTQAVALAGALRDAAAARLAQAAPELAGVVGAALIGRSPDDAPRLDAARRVRLVPVPSIGSEHVDRGIRRLLVEIPSGCPLRADDVAWAFSGLELLAPTGTRTLVTRADDGAMLAHYGIGDDDGHRHWRSVTPLALHLGHRRSDPDPVGGPVASDRLDAERRAAFAVGQALRHAGVGVRVDQLSVQREPFEGKGSRAGDFAAGTRFTAERLWHVDLVFDSPVRGLLLLGDGRFLGLGLMAPERQAHRAVVFQVTDGLAGEARPEQVVAAFRRAVLACCQAALGPRADLPPFVSGHDKSGPIRGDHLAFAFDADSRHLVAYCPQEPARLSKRDRESWRLVERALEGLSVLRAGRAGRLDLVRLPKGEKEARLFGASRRWTSLTPYAVNRHAKRSDAMQLLTDDVVASCRIAGLPEATVEVLDIRVTPGVGLTGNVGLRFPIAISGPVALGRTRYKGGGLFVPALDEA